jgi:hypothetical protein
MHPGSPTLLFLTLLIHSCISIGVMTSAIGAFNKQQTSSLYVMSNRSQGAPQHPFSVKRVVERGPLSWATVERDPSMGHLAWG